MAGPGQSCRSGFVVTGQVQGVGFRPFVHRLAVRLGLTGWAVNDSVGVTVEVQGDREAVERFARCLRAEAPPLAEIDEIRVTDLPRDTGEIGFSIRPSRHRQADSCVADAQVTVDTATCDDCLSELHDPSNPRYHYSFINCTNCGPRYTIIRRVPYDRPNTTMAEFPMCGLCAGEYADPANRRYHAQPIACRACGPDVWLVDTAGRQIPCEDAIAEAARRIADGRIAAIKGLGGFHLACRADSEHVVRRLRQRKCRDAKPLAIMVADIAAAKRLCDVDAPAEALLAGAIRPIVLLPRRPGAPVADAVAEHLNTLGIMLPYTPLHHLLLGCESLSDVPLVMTSGNLSDEPLVKDNADAIAHLARIADVLVLHNRPIERAIDDSIVSLSPSGRAMVLRRARGYAPRPIQLHALPRVAPAVLAVGGELKNTVCLLSGQRAIVGEHIGDLKDGRTYRHFIDTINHLESLFSFRPEVLACDAHPNYLSTEYAVRRHRGELGGREAVPMVRVQHHHAHAAACLVENGRSGPAIGLVCDGTGYGDDGAVWGCEVLRADLLDYERLGHLRYLPLPGGDAAARETHRPAIAALYDTYGPGAAELSITRERFDRTRTRRIVEMLDAGVSCPPSSSLGRWFDAVAALCGLAEENRYEGEAPMRLESAAASGVRDVYAYDITGTGPFEIDLRPMVRGIVGDLSIRCEASYISAKFHNTVARFLAAAAKLACEQTALNCVVLSGGCFANRYLTERLATELKAGGFECLTHRRIPCNDGGVALGQAAVAAARVASRQAAVKAQSSPSRHAGQAER